MKTPKIQLERVKDWERRNPERAQARKKKWEQSAKGRAWLAANQKKKNKRRDAWNPGRTIGIPEARAAFAKAKGGI